MEPVHFGLEQFELHEIERGGGMSTVQKAVLLAGHTTCALKILRQDGDQELAATSFTREVRALSNLEHRNIVKLIGVGVDGARRFIVLEWLEETLRDRLAAVGAADWITFYEQTGRPLLAALQYAHYRGVVHRDLKPLNVMFTRTGVPKITDFGIARAVGDVRLGKTFARAGSHPWTPAEQDDGTLSERRDLYSWAAICVACLTGRQDFKTSSELREAVDRLGNVAPGFALRSCLADDPSARPATATELLWDVDDFHRTRLAEIDKERLVTVEILTDAHTNLEELLPALVDADGRIEALLADFSPACDVCLLPQGDLEIVGGTFCMRAGRTGDSPWLLVKSVRLVGNETPLEPRIEARIKFQERLSGSLDLEQSRSTLDFFQGTLATTLERQRVAQRRRDEERYLLMLQEILAAKIRSLKDMPSIEFVDGHWEGGDFVVLLEGDEPPEPGERRVIRAGGRINVVDVLKVFRDRVHMRPIGPLRGGLPEKGILEVDIAAQRRALERQDDAVRTIRAEGSVLPALKRLILKPEEVEPPELGGRPPPPGLSEDKVAVLDAALGIRQMMAVRGPPGTGKTTLITELVKGVLRENPDAKVLIAAQTHVAIDHIISKLIGGYGAGRGIVRIARPGDEKVAEHVRGITLQECVLSWCKRISASARAFGSTRGAQLGLDAAEVERVVRLESLVWACQRRTKLQPKLSAGDRSLIDAEEAASSSQSPDQLETATVAAMSVAELQAERERLDAAIDRLRAELRELGADGAYLADAPEEQLEENLQILEGAGTAWEQFRREIGLQVSWIDSLGQLKQFEEPVLRSASVVAGTCVGLGSNDAFSTLSFDLCIIDEASKAAATEALIPMVRSNAFLIVGDPKQLPPFDSGALNLDDFSDEEAKRTLLDHLLSKLPKECVFELTHQHRMCKGIGDLINFAFYGNLVNKRPDSDRPGWLQKLYPRPVVWLDTRGSPQRKQGHTFINAGEQRVVLDVLKKLQHGAGRAKANVSVSVIAGYAAQAYALENSIQKNAFGSLSIEVATVDSFQGRETDVTIFSVTLSNGADYLGFMRSAKRLNVALSRPKDLLVIVGDQDFCFGVKGENPFVKVVEHIDANPATCETKDAVQ